MYSPEEIKRRQAAAKRALKKAAPRKTVRKSAPVKRAS
jgi:hypothetical protein